jgi:hypothetical protein
MTRKLFIYVSILTIYLTVRILIPSFFEFQKTASDFLTDVPRILKKMNFKSLSDVKLTSLC